MRKILGLVGLWICALSLQGAPTLEADRLAVVKVQIFLDGSPFKPGKIDGKWGGFTENALAAFQKEKGIGEVKFDGKDLSKLPDEVKLKKNPFRDYEVTPADLKFVGELPGAGEVEAKSKLERLLYGSPGELVAEKFHVDLDFLKQLNAGLDLAALKAGDKVTVPDVENPFALGEVKKGEAEGDADSMRLEISTKTNLLTFYRDGKLAAVYPVSTGSEKTPAPLGDWEITSVTFLPTFRWDKQMLEEGKRSDDAFVLPPGPNSPVGIVWAALNSDGIGIHGSSEADTIGYAASHGCVRLANWDAWELTRQLVPGVKVVIK